MAPCKPQHTGGNSKGRLIKIPVMRAENNGSLKTRWQVQARSAESEKKKDFSKWEESLFVALIVKTITPTASAASSPCRWEGNMLAAMKHLINAECIKNASGGCFVFSGWSRVSETTSQSNKYDAAPERSHNILQNKRRVGANGNLSQRSWL